MKTAKLVTENIVGWAPGTHQYACSDGKHLAVEATVKLPGKVVSPIGEGPMPDELVVARHDDPRADQIVVRPTVVFLCGEEGEPIDADENDHDPLTPLHVFPAGTTHEQALADAGYKVG